MEAPEFPASAPADLLAVWVASRRFRAATTALRAANRLAPEELGGPLAHFAFARARHLVALDRPSRGLYLTHDDLLDDGTSARAALASFGYPATLENLFAAGAWPVPELAPTVDGVVRAWASDQGHKRAMITHGHAGYGWAYTPGGRLFVVGIFGDPA